MSGNGNSGKELFNRIIKAGRRTYFISVKEASNSRKYVTVTESKLVDKGNFDRFRIMIFQERIGDFVQALQDAYQVVA